MDLPATSPAPASVADEPASAAPGTAATEATETGLHPAHLADTQFVPALVDAPTQALADAPAGAPQVHTESRALKKPIGAV